MTDDERPPVSFIAWSPVLGRSHEIARALGGEALRYYGRGRFGGVSVLGRYAKSAIATTRYLRRRRPRSVIATNSPIVPGILAWAYGRWSGAPVALDSHPGGFGLQGDRVSRVLQPVHSWLARRVTTTLVTDRRLADRVVSWGRCADVVHEAPIDWHGGGPRSLRPRPQVLFVCVFQRDEPVEELLEAARLLPALDVHVTGDLRRCPARLRERASPNVRFTASSRGRTTRARYSRRMLSSP